MNKGNQVSILPKQIGIIWVKSSRLLGIETTCSYSSVVLYNCKLNNNFDWVNIIDKEDLGVNEIIEILHNISSIHNLTNTKDEENFYKIHMLIEILGSKFLSSLINISQKHSENANISME